MFFYHEDSEMYVGGTDIVVKLDVDDYHVLEVGVSQPHFVFCRFTCMYTPHEAV